MGHIETGALTHTDGSHGDRGTDTEIWVTWRHGYIETGALTQTDGSHGDMGTYRLGY